MARGGRGGHHQPQRRTVDLTGVISAAEKSDLIILVTAISEKMYRDINRLFDSPQAPLLKDQGPNPNWLALALRHHESNEKENAAPPSSFANTPANAVRKQPHIHEDTTAESLPTQLRELKKEAIVHFRKWQANLLQRLRDLAVVNVDEQQASRGRGRGYRGAAPRGRGGGRGGRPIGRGGATAPIGLPKTPPNHVDPMLVRRYPAVPNNLWPLPYERRKVLLHIMLLISLSLHDYNANTRVLLVNLTSSMNLPLTLHNEDEARIAKGLAEAAMELSPEMAAAYKEENRLLKRWKFCLAGGSAGGNGLARALLRVGVGSASSGLTAPAAAALLGSMSENSLLMGSLFGMNPSKPIDKMVESFVRDVQDFAFLSVTEAGDTEYRDARLSIPSQRRLRLVIALCGFMLEGDAVTTPWSCLGQQSEIYVVQWELAAVASLGNALETVVKSTAWHNARQQIRQNSIFHCLLTSTWPVPLLKISKIIDNPWSVGMVRAEKVGLVLADAIMRHKFHGERSVSLVGYSLAARAIYACLMILAERRQFGLIDSVVLMGTPAPSDSKVWVTLKSVVSGRLINAYTEEDYILGFLYRTSNTQFGIAGLQEIQCAAGVENHRVSHLPNGHLSYQNLAAQILREVGWDHGSRTAKM